MVVIAWSPYIRNAEKLEVKVFWPGDGDPQEFLLNDLGMYDLLNHAIRYHEQTKGSYAMYPEMCYIEWDEEDEDNIAWSGDLCDLCAIIERTFVGDGSYACVYLTVKDGDEYLLQV